MIEQAQKEGTTVHFATLMDWCHFQKKKKTPIGRHVPKYTEGRVVLRGDVVEDDCGSCEVFTVQGSSASHMSGASVLDVISRLPGCAGQASDAVSANAQVKLEDAPRLKNIQNQNVQMFGYVFHDTNGQNHGGKLKIPWYLLNEIYMVPFAGLLWERQFEQALLELGWEKVPNWECVFVHWKQWYFCQKNVDDIKMSGKKQNLALMWKKLTEKR